MNDRFTKNLKPPYYAVIFTNLLSEEDDGYAEMADAMFELAMEQEGCLGAESARDNERLGITVSYWKDEESILAWKKLTKHMAAQKMGIERWYKHYELRVAKVERNYSGPEDRTPG